MKRRTKRLAIMWGLIILSAAFLAFSNYERVANGYFTSSPWIFVDNFGYVVFFGLVSGFIIAHILKKLDP